MLKETPQKIRLRIGRILKSCRINKNTLKKLDSEKERYNYVLIKTFCATLLAAAARAREALNFFEEDIKLEKMSSTGLIKILFRTRNGMSRINEKIIPFWGFFLLMAPHVKLYLDTVKKRDQENKLKFSKEIEIKSSTGKLLFKGPPFFRDFNGRPLTYDKAKVLLDWMLKVEQLKPIQFSDFRPASAILAYKRREYMEKIQALLDQKSLKQTRQYYSSPFKKERKISHNLADIPTEDDLN